MDHTISESNGYGIIALPKQLSMLSDIEFLTGVVYELLTAGNRRIALKLAENSYLSSHSISVLIKCNELIREADGEFLIVGGGEELERYLVSLGIEERFSICRPSDELARVLG